MQKIPPFIEFREEEPLQTRVVRHYLDEKTKKWGFRDNFGKILIKPSFAYADKELNLNTPTPVKNDNQLWGAIDTTVTLVIDFKYEFLRFYKDRETGLYSRNGKNGLINRFGEEILPPTYDLIFFQKHPVIEALLVKDNLWGACDKNGDIILPTCIDCHHMSIRPDSILNVFFDTDSCTLTSEKVSFQNKNKLLPFVKYFSQCIIVTGKYDENYEDFRCALVDTLLNPTTPLFRGIYFYKNHFFVSTIDKKNGIFGTDGTWILEPKYDIIHQITEDTILVKIGRKMGLLLMDETFIIPPKFKKIEIPYSRSSDQIFYQGKCAVKKGWKWGYVDTTGSMVIQPKFYDAEEFHEGRAIVKIRKWAFKVKRTWLPFFLENDVLSGVIDEQGNWVYKPQNVYIRDYKNGIARVHERRSKWNTNLRTYYIDLAGNELTGENL